MRKLMLMIPILIGMGNSTDSAQNHVQSTLEIEVEEFNKRKDEFQTSQPRI